MTRRPRQLNRKGCALTFAAAIAATMIFGALAWWVADDVFENVDLGECIDSDRARVDYVARQVEIDRAPLETTRTWLGVGLVDFALLPTDAPADPSFVLRNLSVKGVSPDSRYVHGFGSGGDPVVVRLSDGRMLVHVIGAGSNLVLAASGRAFVVVSDNTCDPGRLVTIDLATQRTVRSRRIERTFDGVKPIQIVGDTLIAEQVVPGDNAPESRGVLAVNLRTARVRELTDRGVVATVTADPVRVWITDRRRTRVLTLDGREVGRIDATVTAGQLDDGSVAYSLFQDEPAVLRVGSVDGPEPGDPTVRASGRVVEVVGLPDGSAGVSWDEAPRDRPGDRRAGIDVCEPSAGSCRLIWESGALTFGQGLVGTLTTPVPDEP